MPRPHNCILNDLVFGKDGQNWSNYFDKDNNNDINNLVFFVRLRNKLGSQFELYHIISRFW